MTLNALPTHRKMFSAKVFLKMQIGGTQKRLFRFRHGAAQSGFRQRRLFSAKTEIPIRAASDAPENPYGPALSAKYSLNAHREASSRAVILTPDSSGLR